MRPTLDGVASRFLRFAFTGLLCTLLYGVLTAWLAGSIHLSPVWATVLGYAAVVPLNFVIQRSFSFRSENGARGDLARFACVHGGNILGSAAIMQALVILHLDYRIGILLTMTLVPVAIFFLLDRWVFASRRTSRNTDSPR